MILKSEVYTGMKQKKNCVFPVSNTRVKTRNIIDIRFIEPVSKLFAYTLTYAFYIETGPVQQALRDSVHQLVIFSTTKMWPNVVCLIYVITTKMANFAN